MARVDPRLWRSIPGVLSVFDKQWNRMLELEELEEGSLPDEPLVLFQ